MDRRDLAGSVARGEERPDSDVDVYVVVDEGALEAAAVSARLSFLWAESVTYEGGYVDVKLASLAQMEAAAERGDEPTRASFKGARVVWASNDAVWEGISSLVRSIPELSDDEWDRRVASHIAYLRLQAGYFARHGFAVKDEYLIRHAVFHSVMSAHRALLVHHRILFQGHKYLSSILSALPALPEGHMEAAGALLNDPRRERLEAFVDSVLDFADWPLADSEVLGRYVADQEFAWYFGTLPTEYQ